MQGRYEDALDEIDRCLNNNWHNHKERALKYLAEVEALDNNHIGARQFRTLIDLNL